MTTPPPPHPWLPPESVLDHVGLDTDDAQAGNVERSRVAAAAWVEAQRSDLWVTTGAGTEEDPTVRTYTPPDNVVQGAVLLAARFVARRASPAGLASYGEFGPANVPRLDVDVLQLLGLGRNATPRIG